MSHQGVKLRSSGDPVLYLSNPDGISRSDRRKVLDGLAELNGKNLERYGDPETEARISQYEMAFRMQTSVPELADVSDEPQHVLDMYGAKPGDGSYASNCLLARRMVERGVRFVQIFHRGWDHHGGLVKYMDVCCGLTDKPTWALITDLKQRGLLDSTLVVWGTEFGRTPVYQQIGGPKKKHVPPGRGHNPFGWSLFMAGRPGDALRQLERAGDSNVSRRVAGGEGSKAEVRPGIG